jgi:hypothetical protein
MSNALSSYSLMLRWAWLSIFGVMLAGWGTITLLFSHPSKAVFQAGILFFMTCSFYIIRFMHVSRAYTGVQGWKLNLLWLNYCAAAVFCLEIGTNPSLLEKNVVAWIATSMLLFESTVIYGTYVITDKLRLRNLR